MPSYRQVAAKVAAHKREHPERYCPAPGCLWMTGDGSRCPRHPAPRVTHVGFSGTGNGVSMGRG